MKIGILGRTNWMLDTARFALAGGHELTFVATAKESEHSSTNSEEFRELALEVGCPFAQGSKDLLNLGASISNTDIALSVNWPTLLPQRFLDQFSFGVLNAHAGDLPRYRGNACPNWAILNGEPKVVLTIHKMVADLDSGPIAAQRSFILEPTSDITDVYKWLTASIPDLFLEAIENSIKGSLRPQDLNVTPLRTFPRIPEDGRINWRESALAIDRLVKASSRPFAGAFCRLSPSGNEIRVWKSRLFPYEHDFLAVPGQVCFASSAGNAVISTNNGLLELVQVSSEVGDHEATTSLILASLRSRLV